MNGGVGGGEEMKYVGGPGSIHLRLDGLTVLVTGGGRGIGAAAACTLAKAGAHVVVMSRTTSDLEQVVNNIQVSGGHASALACDVTDGHRVREMITELSRLDILINNAGMNIPEPFIDVSEEHLDTVINLNLRANFLVAQAAVRKMLEAPNRREIGGAVVNVTSQMGHVGAPRRTVYCLTKHAVEGLTKAMAVELAPENIRVNSIAPTFLETPMTAPFFRDTNFRNWVLQRIPLGRLGQLNEVTTAILFLVSPAASLITGTSLVVDGGWTAQ